jgi:hypothetical protein
MRRETYFRWKLEEFIDYLVLFCGRQMGGGGSMRALQLERVESN